ncbi:MAG TPA: hypothetical protein VGD55_07860, partial [Acidothermaceae bacterium]
MHQWPTNPVAAAGLIAIAVLICVALAGRSGSGFDATWALVWARDLLHGHVAAAAPKGFTSTPHPATVLLAIAIRLIGAGHASAILWAAGIEIAAIALFGGLIRAGQLVGAPLAGVCGALVLAVQPGLRDAIGRGTIDIVFAAVCVWAIVLMWRRPAWAIGCASVAALCRPEGWWLLSVMLPLHWERSRPTIRLVVLGAMTITPIVWLVMGRAMFGDPLAALRITVTNGNGLRTHHGMGALVHGVAAAPGIAAAVLLVSVVAAINNRRHIDALDLATVVGALMLGTLAFEVLVGAEFVDRYLIATIALMMPGGLRAVLALATRQSTPKLLPAAICWALVVIGVASTWSQYAVVRRNFAAQADDVASLA